MNRVALLACIFLTCAEAADAQASGQRQITNLAWLLKSTGSCRTSQAGRMSCVAVLSVPVTTKGKGNAATDHVFLDTYAGPQGLTRLEAMITEVETGVNGRSILRVQISKGETLDGHEIHVEARIVAVVSPSKVTEKWDVPLVVVDRFPGVSEGDRRQPGERTLSENPHHISPLDSLSDFPLSHAVVCSEKVKQPGTNACTDLREARVHLVSTP
jgi:hypothetical protein